MFSYPGGETLSFHTGAQEGRFLSTTRRDPRVRVQAAAAEMGLLHPGKPYACNSARVYTSVVAFGRVRIVEDDETKTWFFDRLLEKYSDPSLFEPGYPYLDHIVLSAMTIEILTGKRSEGRRH